VDSAEENSKTIFPQKNNPAERGCFFVAIVLSLAMELINKEQFLEKHNKLSPASLQATLALLDKFREEKKPQLKDSDWCLDKFRIPFISWLTATQERKKRKVKKTTKKQAYKNYPETHYEA